mmetsp:Transcript_30248/g.64361  ORF Transcript_30248/g.64361 Transcript_30248/m.64361 type:complete len:217 (+) Transcript_30248:693-1343(+)
MKASKFNWLTLFTLRRCNVSVAALVGVSNFSDPSMSVRLGLGAANSTSTPCSSNKAAVCEAVFRMSSIQFLANSMFAIRPASWPACCSASVRAVSTSAARRSFKLVSPSKFTVEMKACPSLARISNTSAGMASSARLNKMSPQRTSLHLTWMNWFRAQLYLITKRLFSASSSLFRRLSSQRSLNAVQRITTQKGTTVVAGMIGESSCKTNMETKRK